MDRYREVKDTKGGRGCAKRLSAELMRARAGFYKEGWFEFRPMEGQESRPVNEEFGQISGFFGVGRLVRPLPWRAASAAYDGDTGLSSGAFALGRASFGQGEMRFQIVGDLKNQAAFEGVWKKSRRIAEDRFERDRLKLKIPINSTRLFDSIFFRAIRSARLDSARFGSISLGESTRTAGGACRTVIRKSSIATGHRGERSFDDRKAYYSRQSRFDKPIEFRPIETLFAHPFFIAHRGSSRSSIAGALGHGERSCRPEISLSSASSHRLPFGFVAKCTRIFSLGCQGLDIQRLLSKKSASWDLERAPTLVASTFPFLNSIKVGMPRMPYLGGVSGLLSMSSFATFSRPAYSSATSTRIGAIALQGPHHSAQ